MKLRTGICILYAVVGSVALIVCLSFYFQSEQPRTQIEKTRAEQESEQEPETETEYVSPQAVYTSAENIRYLLLEADNEIVVYYANDASVYLYTGICMDDLPKEVQNQVFTGITFTSDEELYDFLESYTS